MLKVIATDVIVSKGYNGAPALKFSEKGDSVRFRIGKKFMTLAQKIINAG